MTANPRTVKAPLGLLLFLFGIMGLTQLYAAEQSQTAFQPKGMWIWDNWFIHDGERWHAFYLQLPKAVGLERRWKDNDPYKHVGHAISTNLVDWQDAGPALCALSGTWNDRHIATGSVLRHEGRWWMFFTGRGRQGDGVGLALSDDLMTWKTEPRPVFSLADTFSKNGEAPFESQWEGKPRRWVGISDPYVYPEPVDGWIYLTLCSRILDVPIEESGCLTMLRSRDLRHWEPAGIVAWPRCFERMETPQIWPREGRWYCSFGGVLTEPWAAKNQASFPDAVRGKRSHQNYCFVLSDIQQSARADDLHHIAAAAGNYIMKVLKQPNGSDVALFTSTDARGTCLSQPYSVRYLANGELQLERMPRPDVTK